MRLRILCGFLFLFFLSVDGAQAFRRIAVGDALADIALEEISGAPTSLHLSCSAQKLAIVVFWASWSPRSEEALRDLAKISRELPQVCAVGINVEHQEWSDADLGPIREVSTRAGAAFPVLLDKGLIGFERLGVTAVPSWVIADAAWRVQNLLPGYPATQREEFWEEIRARVEGRSTSEPAPVSTGHVPSREAAREFGMATVTARRGQVDKAIRHLRNAVAADPAFEEARRKLEELEGQAKGTETAR